MTHWVGIDEDQVRAKKISDDIENILASLDTVPEAAINGQTSLSLPPGIMRVGLTPYVSRRSY